jgi:hypothetical protein
MGVLLTYKSTPSVFWALSNQFCHTLWQNWRKLIFATTCCKNDNLKSILPSIEDIENELTKSEE